MNLILLAVLKVIVSATFLAAGAAKLAKVRSLVAQFHDFRLPPGIMYLIGIMEILGAIALWFDFLTFWAFSGLACLMLGAMKSHINAKHSLSRLVPPAVLFGLCTAGALLFNWLSLNQW